MPAIVATIDSVRTIALKGRKLLVDPADAAIDEDGRLVVTDRADKVLKAVSMSGDMQTFGRPGKGPGEFQSLVSGGVWNRGVFGYDLIARSLRVYDSSATFVENIALGSDVPTPFASIRTADDSLVLATGWIPSGRNPAIRIFDRRGRQVSAMFPAWELTRDLNPRAHAAMGVVADLRSGLVFAAAFGYDTLIVYDLKGRTLATTTLRIASSQMPILRLPERVKSNNGELRRPDGSWVQEGTLGIRAVIALDSGVALVQLAPVDFSRKYDLLEQGGPVLVMQYGGGALRIAQETYIPGALLGRDRSGNGLALRWRGTNLDAIDLFRVSIRTRGAR